jgi:small subunit ribosomal protein S5
MGDAATAQEAVAAAYMNAFQRLEAVPLYRGHTIYNHIVYDYNKMTVSWMGV